MSHRPKNQRRYRIAGEDPKPGDNTKKFLDDLVALASKYKIYLFAGGVAYLYVKNIGDDQ